MIPIRTSVEVHEIPGAVFGLIIANVVVFLVQTQLPPDLAKQFILHNALIPARYTQPGLAAELGLRQLNVLPFVTSVFMHVNWLHLVVNMWVLWLLGGPVEQAMGAPRFVLLYLVSGLVAGVAHFALNLTSAVPTLGASGAIAGVLGGFALLYPKARVLFLKPILFFPFVWELPAPIFLGLWFVFQVVSGLVRLLEPKDVGGIAWWAHIGGFVAGLVLVRVIGTPRPRIREVGPARPLLMLIGTHRPLVVRMGARTSRRPSFGTFGRLRKSLPASPGPSRIPGSARTILERAGRGVRALARGAAATARNRGIPTQPPSSPKTATRRSRIPDSGP